MCMLYFRAVARLNSKDAYILRPHLEADTLKDINEDSVGFWASVDLIMLGFQPTPATLLAYKHAAQQSVLALEDGKGLPFLQRRIKASALMHVEFSPTAEGQLDQTEVHPIHVAHTCVGSHNN